MRKSRRVAIALLLLAVVPAAVAGLTACASASTYKQVAPSSSSMQAASENKTKVDRKTYADIPTPYPKLYHHDAQSGWLNDYDESKVISYAEAHDHVGQDMTVEGTADSVVYAASSNGAPYFFNMGGDAYAPGGFAIVVWSQDIAKFDQNALFNYVEWSKSDQPITSVFRVSGTIELYNDRPQIVARDGSQIATQMEDGSWFSMMADDDIDALMDAIYH